MFDQDGFVFLEYLQDAHDKFGAVFHTYSLMGNHYHGLLETPKGNLSRIMHFINASYTGYFNKKHSRVGHLFQGRFKAILIETDSYASELSRYIHLNPVRGKIVEMPEEYRWSSYQEFLGQRSPAPWLNVNLVLGYFGRDLNVARSRYRNYVIEAIGRTLENPIKKAEGSLILGREEFVNRIKAKFFSIPKENREIPAIRALKEKPALDEIIRSVGHKFGAKNRFSRNAAIYLCCKRTDYSLAEMEKFFGIKKSTISMAYTQVKELITLDDSLKEILGEIESSLFK